MNTVTRLHPESTMADVLATFPGARRALFRRYHLGGCASCGFRPEETLAAVCERAGKLDVDEVLAHLEASHQGDLEMLIEPEALAAELGGQDPVRPRLLDLRPQDEWETARIPGSEPLSEATVQTLLSSGDRQAPIVFIDHQGKESLDAAAYFAGHGFTRVRALRGGVDAWAQRVDPSVPRYRLD